LGIKFIIPYIITTAVAEANLRINSDAFAFDRIRFAYCSHRALNIIFAARAVCNFFVFHFVAPYDWGAWILSASGGVTPAAATERKERGSRVPELHPEKYTLSGLRPNYQKSSRIFSHQGDQSELRGATPNFWPQSFNHFFLGVSRVFRPGQPSSPKVIEGFRQTMNTRIAKAPGRD
jgi:hypothetical protein